MERIIFTPPQLTRKPFGRVSVRLSLLFPIVKYLFFIMPISAFFVFKGSITQTYLLLVRTFPFIGFWFYQSVIFNTSYVLLAMNILKMRQIIYALLILFKYSVKTTPWKLFLLFFGVKVLHGYSTFFFFYIRKSTQSSQLKLIYISEFMLFEKGYKFEIKLNVW